MASMWSTEPSPDTPTDKDIADVADTGVADIGLPAPQIPANIQMSRPQLLRNQPAPPPPHQPPPPPAPQLPSNTNDSLSLMQLKRIVNDFPRVDPTIYTFEYADSARLEEEIEEWFCYDETEYNRLHKACDGFRNHWAGIDKEWIIASKADQKKFVEQEIDGLHDVDLQGRGDCLRSILHVVLGIWDDTARVDTPVSDSEEVQAKTKASHSQLQYMQNGIELVIDCGGLPVLYDVMQKAFERLWTEELAETRSHDDDEELDNVMTIIYVILEEVRADSVVLESALEAILNLNPNMLVYFTTITAKLRWDESNDMPQTRIFLLLWKTILVMLGGTEVIDGLHRETDELANADSDATLITASPLDYHIFRQEIISKYPAYVPPAPLLPLEPDNYSILPPLPNRPSRPSANGIMNATASVNSTGASILHQPVHIATPAPSPPPSPPIGGKSGKKQNYQTNQNFPFLYPPLDSTSCNAGGKGSAGLQSLLVGRKFEGSDIPKSILEAGELFAKRMRITRAIRQLWEEREQFLKFGRGWHDNEDVDDIELEGERKEDEARKERKKQQSKVDYGPHSLLNDDVKRRLDLVEKLCQESLPHLQSLVIVLLKAILINVTALITQLAQEGTASSFRSDANTHPNGQTQNKAIDIANNGPLSAIDTSMLPIESLDAMRTREITAKAISGILLLISKWFKISHILKFEYFTQLLLDSNYLPLVLKLFAHQEIESIVDSKTDREDMGFFSFCLANSKHNPLVEATSEVESEDDAVPPPIKLHHPATRGEDRAPVPTFDNVSLPSKEPPLQSQPMRREGAEAEESEPQPDASSEYRANGPITDFSWRNFFSTINFLRVMQKICKNKAHRNLLLVQYKSSNILKKTLKIPQAELRLYTLKLFKNQVPYCGRKWRQGNMRVITAVYLHCRPELRDDWLAGSDIDAEVEEALPLEQALRSLTHWYNVRRYPDQMGVDSKMLEEEKDFFVGELEKLETELAELGLLLGDESGDVGWEEGHAIAW